MKRPAKPIGRRIVLGGAAATWSARVSAAPAEPQPNTLIVAGPTGARLDRWAELLAARVGRGLPGRQPLQRQNIGGLDGVTGANQFEARGEPDGTTALLVPGIAVLSWLVGDARAKFDPGHWVPLWAGAGSAVLVSKVPLVAGRRIRVGAEGPAGPELPALLALDMMGVDAQPVGAASPDAVLLRGADVAPAISTAAASGMAPVMTFGLAGAAAAPERDRLLPGVPTAFELTAGRSTPAMAAALRAAAVTVQIDSGLMLPQLTSAAAVSLWRNACSPLQSDPEVAAEAARTGLRMISALEASECRNRIAGDPNILLALRSWLATRYAWRPA